MFLICRSVLLTGRELVGFVSDNIFQCSLRAYDKMFGIPNFHEGVTRTWKFRSHKKEDTNQSSKHSTNLGLECICPCSPVVQYRTTWETVAWKHQKAIVGKQDADSRQESISSINSFKDTHGYTVHRKGIVNWINQRALLLQLKSKDVSAIIFCLKSISSYTASLGISVSGLDFCM